MGRVRSLQRAWTCRSDTQIIRPRFDVHTAVAVRQQDTTSFPSSKWRLEPLFLDASRAPPAQARTKSLRQGLEQGIGTADPSVRASRCLNTGSSRFHRASPGRD